LQTETSLREIVRNEQDKGRRLQQELSGLRESVDELSQQQASARVQAERVSDDLRDRQQRHSSASGSLDERVQTLEAKLAEASDTIAALRDKEAEESRRHSRALADASETMAQVISRVKQVEERVVPDVQRYVDKSNQEFWTPSQTEISELRRRIELLRSALLHGLFCTYIRAVGLFCTYIRPLLPLHCVSFQTFAYFSWRYASFVLIWSFCKCHNTAWSPGRVVSFTTRRDNTYKTGLLWGRGRKGLLFRRGPAICRARLLTLLHRCIAERRPAERPPSRRSHACTAGANGVHLCVCVRVGVCAHART
jgi:hypothetical protein